MVGDPSLSHDSPARGQTLAPQGYLRALSTLLDSGMTQGDLVFVDGSSGKRLGRAAESVLEVRKKVPNDEQQHQTDEERLLRVDQT